MALINIMQEKSTLKNGYHMTIRLVDDRLAITPRKEQQLHQNQFQPKKCSLSDIYHKRTSTKTVETPSHQKSNQIMCIRHKSFSCSPDLFDTSHPTVPGEKAKQSQLKNTNNSDRTDKSKCSVGNQICTNFGSQTLTLRPEQFSSLQFIQCILSTSIHQGDSYEFDQADSEIISLTEDQKDFFQNFVTPEPHANTEMQELFKRLSLQTSEPVTQKTQEQKSLPQNKLKVIRNFFKPKEEIAKYKKKGASSRIINDQIAENLKTDHNLGSLGQQEKKDYSKSDI